MERGLHSLLCTHSLLRIKPEWSLGTGVLGTGSEHAPKVPSWFSVQQATHPGSGLLCRERSSCLVSLCSPAVSLSGDSSGFAKSTF